MKDFGIVSTADLESATEYVRHSIEATGSTVSEDILLAVLLANRQERKEKGN